jgi:hypothetical protein
MIRPFEAVILRTPHHPPTALVWPGTTFIGASIVSRSSAVPRAPPRLPVDLPRALSRGDSQDHPGALVRSMEDFR